jgi:hypothetical protein
MNACEPFVTEESLRVAGSVVPGQQIGWQGLTRELWAGADGCCGSPWNRVKISTDLVVSARGGDFTPLAAPPPGLNPATLRHLPWLKLRVAGCRDGSQRPIWLDLGQTIVLPTRSASAAIVGPATFFEVAAANADVVVPPGNAEQTTLDAWIIVRVEETTCCEPSDALLTDTAIIPADGEGSVALVIPPRARCLTIHKGDGSAVTVEWEIDEFQMVVGTSGMPAVASQLVLTVPEAMRVRLSSAGPAQQVVLVWGLRL